MKLQTFFYLISLFVFSCQTKLPSSSVPKFSEKEIVAAKNYQKEERTCRQHFEKIALKYLEVVPQSSHFYEYQNYIFPSDPKLVDEIVTKMEVKKFNHAFRFQSNHLTLKMPIQTVKAYINLFPRHSDCTTKYLHPFFSSAFHQMMYARWPQELRHKIIENFMSYLKLNLEHKRADNLWLDTTFDLLSRGEFYGFWNPHQGTFSNIYSNFSHKQKLAAKKWLPNKRKSDIDEIKYQGFSSDVRDIQKSYYDSLKKLHSSLQIHYH